MIVLPWPPSNNTYYAVVRGRKVLSAKGRQYREAVAQQARDELWPAYAQSVAVEIEAWMPDRRRRDLDNILKAALDALTHAQVWIDDSQVDDLRIYRAPQLGGMLKVTIKELA